MKKLMFSACSLGLGGIETALVTLVNYLVKNGYDVTVALEKKEGIFLNSLDKNVKIIEYSPSEERNILKRKLVNLLKRIKFTIKYKNRFDFSACFATYSLPANFMARVASKNTCLWCHADYLTLFQNDKNKVKEFFKERKYNKFKNIVFVSNEGKESFVNILKDAKEKTIVCNNMIDGEKIINLSKEKIDVERKSEIITFLNVGRHDEWQKRLSRLIEASSKLKYHKYKFRILLVGEGQDTEKYKRMVKEKELENNIIFIGKKENPYPYFNVADCVILTSEYEGYPVVFLESKILNKPIITTKVSDYEEIEEKYGYVTDKDVDDIYHNMKKFIENGYQIKERFDYNKYNEEILKRLEELF